MPTDAGLGFESELTHVEGGREFDIFLINVDGTGLEQVTFSPEFDGFPMFSLDGTKLVEAGLKGRCLVDFARMQMVYRKDVPRLIETLGVEAMAFGTHMPFDYVAPSLIKLANVELLRPADRDALAWKNAARFLGLS